MPEEEQGEWAQKDKETEGREQQADKREREVNARRSLPGDL